MKKTIFWFRQDLRVFDNTWFLKSVRESDEVLPVFILDENIMPVFWGLSDKKFLFLKEALLSLDEKLKKLWWQLLVIKGRPEQIIPELIEKYGIAWVYANRSYSEYWTNRDSKISKSLFERWIIFDLSDDYLIVSPENIPQRKVFTPFYKLWSKFLSNNPVKLKEAQKFIWVKTDLEAKCFLDSNIFWGKHPYFTLELLENRLTNFDFANYELSKDFLDKDWTSKLSVFLRFGIVSPRELYLKAIDSSETYIKELAWRDFWHHIMYYFPFTKNLEFQEKRRYIKREWESYLFEKFCKGETGYPVVDAAIKQLIETNRMHGRARMIVASFLTKDLHIDWRLGEKFFKKHLLDYDETVNIWNWQWSASVWADPKPLRIFNPSLQSEKFDKDTKFIKRYLPELTYEEPKNIHNPLNKELSYINTIVDHKTEQKLAREMYKKDS